MRAGWPILQYLISTLLLGALLAPPLFYAGQKAAQFPALHFLGESDFHRYFSRAMLLAALALIYPLLRAIGLRDLNAFAFGLRPNPRWWRHLAGGFLIASAALALLGLLLAAGGVYYWKEPVPWNLLPRVFIGALTVATLEESLFRGLLLGVVMRNARPVPAAVFVSALFAILHFLKPAGDDVTQVHWYSGFAVIPQVFSRFSEPELVVAGFVTLFVLGAMLAHVTLASRSLWLAIGLHSGLVFGKMGFNKIAKRALDVMPWFSADLSIGFGAVLVLLLVWLVSWYLFLRDRSLTPVVERAP